LVPLLTHPSVINSDASREGSVTTGAMAVADAAEDDREEDVTGPAPPALSAARAGARVRDGVQIHAVRLTRIHPGIRSISSRSVPEFNRPRMAPDGESRRFSPSEAATTRSKLPEVLT
jgi:hypothetical protein